MTSLEFLVGKFCADVGWKGEKNVGRRTYHKQKAWIMYIMQVIKQWAVGVLLVLNRDMIFS